MIVDVKTWLDKISDVRFIHDVAIKFKLSLLFILMFGLTYVANFIITNPNNDILVTNACIDLFNISIGVILADIFIIFILLEIMNYICVTTKKSEFMYSIIIFYTLISNIPLLVLNECSLTTVSIIIDEIIGAYDIFMVCYGIFSIYVVIIYFIIICHVVMKIYDKYIV